MSVILENSSHPYADPGGGVVVETYTASIADAVALQVSFNSLTNVYRFSGIIHRLHVYGQLGTHWVPLGPFVGGDVAHIGYASNALANQTVMVPGDTVMITITKNFSGTAYGFKATISAVTNVDTKARPQNHTTFYPPPPNGVGSVSAGDSTGQILRSRFSPLSFSPEISQFDWGFEPGRAPIVPANVQQMFMVVNCDYLWDSLDYQARLDLTLTNQTNQSVQDLFNWSLPWYNEFPEIPIPDYKYNQIYAGLPEQDYLVDEAYWDNIANHIILNGAVTHTDPEGESHTFNEYDIYLWIIFNRGPMWCFMDSATGTTKFTH